MLQYFIQTPAIGGVFIAGFLAPRASWLLGVIVGLVSAVCYSGLILSGALGCSATDRGDQPGHPRGLPDLADHGRALRLRRPPGIDGSSSSRARIAGRRQPPAKRGNDGKTRAANQKAGARR